ncbi:hypothetical protein LTR99_011053 [Exophiala xenobiotica]|uniref:Uncharacterized protein n=1 Tax=Vermiconidia calcicola TaxID=1690605 RepID=A0AAV9PT75_9PEZI|nr:hypothetical protein LTR92_010998 [Exophiala xenobiotica]KAK5527626.1 hypothetical protein LTR25_011041 [Vermiconidia calcicola]KAK5528073.1 hypothetical protein LTR23_011133 [Chaetothyriales sp. CCFEE 6169]KAK5290566.1 hypothetical protein LTR99_011053 [Exophiala xenobiotica]KAK5313017.1 hypothetical protein LTR93_011084 [Exophiala xenobiotica]
MLKKLPVQDKREFKHINQGNIILRLRDQEKLPWKLVESRFATETGLHRAWMSLAHEYYSVRRQSQHASTPEDAQGSPMLWALPPQLFWAMTAQRKEEGASWSEITEFMHEVGEKGSVSGIRARFMATQTYFGMSVGKLRGDEPWLLELLQTPRLLWLKDREVIWAEFPWLAVAWDTISRAADDGSERWEAWRIYNNDWLWQWSIWGKTEMSQDLADDWLTKLIQYEADPKFKQPSGDQVRRDWLLIFHALGVPWSHRCHFFADRAGLRRDSKQLLKNMRGTPSNMTVTLEDHEVEQLLQLGGKHTGKKKPICEELGQKYGLTHRQLRNIYIKEKKRRVRGHENDPPFVQVNASPTMENSPEQEEAKTVLHEASPQEQNIVDPAIIESSDSPTSVPATTANIKQEDLDYTQSNAGSPHEPVPELDDDLKDLSSVPVTTLNIKQESLDHTQSGAYSPHEPVPKLEGGLAVSIDMLEGVQDFPGQMFSMPSQKHEDIKASLDGTIECSVGVSQPLTGHVGGVTCEDGIQKREGSAFLGRGQPVSTYPETFSSLGLDQSKEAPSSFDSARNRRSSRNIGRKRYFEEVEE